MLVTGSQAARLYAIWTIRKIWTRRFANSRGLTRASRDNSADSADGAYVSLRERPHHEQKLGRVGVRTPASAMPVSS